MNEAKLASAYRALEGVAPHALVHDILLGHFDRIRSDLSTTKAKVEDVKRVHSKLAELELIPAELIDPAAAFIQQISQP